MGEVDRVETCVPESHENRGGGTTQPAPHTRAADGRMGGAGGGGASVLSRSANPESAGLGPGADMRFGKRFAEAGHATRARALGFVSIA